MTSDRCNWLAVYLTYNTDNKTVYSRWNDARTDRQTDESPIAKSRRSIAERNKNEDNWDRTLYLYYLNTCIAYYLDLSDFTSVYEI